MRAEFDPDELRTLLKVAESADWKSLDRDDRMNLHFAIIRLKVASGMSYNDASATLPAPCHRCSKVVAYSAVGCTGAYHFRPADDSKQISASNGEWVFDGACGHRTKMTAPGWVNPERSR